jgi:poly-gamma-glutamate synthesis protein (capsule biosynthesis protein)
LLALVALATGAALIVRNTSASARLAPVRPDVLNKGNSSKSAPIIGADSITIVATGEILPHPSVVQHAKVFGRASGVPYDFAALFAPVAAVVQRADLAICHLEVPVAPPGTKLSGYPNFAVPADVAIGIHRTGWDRCSTVSNHTNDQGSAGIKATLDAFDAAKVGHSGSARTAAEAAKAPIVPVRGVHVAHLAYTWGFNGTLPAASWMANVIDGDRILADAHRAKAAGADIVVVSLHWGNEYDPRSSSQQRALADRLLASPDIDLIIGHGPHVLQPIATFHHKYVLMSLGNLVANQGKKRPTTYDGAIATITFTRGANGSYHASAPKVQATWYDAANGRVRLVSSALADPRLAAISSSLRASLARTRSVMGGYVVG